MKYFHIIELLLTAIVHVNGQSTLSFADLKELANPTYVQIQGLDNLYGNNLENNSTLFSNLNNFNTFIDMERTLVPGKLSKFSFTVYVTNANTIIRLQIWRLSSPPSSMSLVWDKRVTLATLGQKFYEANVLADGFMITAYDRIGLAIESGSSPFISINNISHLSYWAQIYTSYPTISIQSSQFKDLKLAMAILIEPALLGNTGSRGVPGQRGFAGRTGYIGNIGATGQSGIIGSPGWPGPIGITGFPGYTGGTGATGAIGFTGPPGLSGLMGPPGNIGIPGLIGSTGQPGYMGSMGHTGAIGDSGFLGKIGLKGDPGPPGIASNAIPGIKGYIGATGNKGVKGQKGLPGNFIPNYISGPQGPIGDTGFSGKVGLPGVQGNPGTVTFIDEPLGNSIKTCYSPPTNEFEQKTGFKNYPICPGKPRTPIILQQGENVIDGTLILKCESLTLDAKTGGSQTIIWSIDNIPIKQDDTSVKTITGDIESKRYTIDGDKLTITSLSSNDNKRWINCFVNIEGYWLPSDPSNDYIIDLTLKGCDSNPCGSNGTCNFLNKTEYNCVCNDGYKNSEPKKCIDIDECAKLPNNCPKNAICQNIIGSYRCNCEFNKEGKNCDQIISDDRITSVTSIIHSQSIISGGQEFCLIGSGLGQPKYAALVPSISGLPTFIAEFSNETNGAICFITPEVERIFIAIPFQVILVYNNGKNVSTNQTISFINNPEISEIEEVNPLYQKEVTFKGSGYDGVNKIELLIDFRKFFKGNQSQNITIEIIPDTNRTCKIVNGYSFKCPLPNLFIPGTDAIILNETYNLLEAVRNSTSGIKIFIYRDFKILFNQKNFEIRANKFFFIPKPKLSDTFSLKKLKKTIIYDHYGLETLKIWGTDLDIILKKEDYNITVGGKKCFVKHLYNDLIECRPHVFISQNKNAYSTLLCSPNFDLIVAVRGKEEFIGCVQPADHSGDEINKSLIVGLTIGLASFALIVLIIVFFFACNKKTLSKAVPTSNKKKSRKTRTNNYLFNETDIQDSMDDDNAYSNYDQVHNERNGQDYLGYEEEDEGERIGGSEYINSTELG